MESVTENVNGNVRQTTPSLQEAGICKLTKGDKDGDMRMLMKRGEGLQEMESHLRLQLA